MGGTDDQGRQLVCIDDYGEQAQTVSKESDPGPQQLPGMKLEMRGGERDGDQGIHTGTAGGGSNPSAATGDS